MSDNLDQLRRDGVLLRAIIGQRVKLKRAGRDWKGLCPFHPEKTPSFTVFDDGHFHCFGCQEHGSVLDFVMKCEGIDLPEARDRILAQAGLATARKNGNGKHQAEEWHSILPVPEDAPNPTDKQLRCDMLHEYRDADDRLLCYVRRIESQGSKGKLFLPLTYGVLNGKRGWHERAPDKPRPLYGLNTLAHCWPIEAEVLLVEGEKAADAAQRMFPDRVAMTWMGGASADGAADLSPLEDRDVIIWPDADAPGRKVAARLAKRLRGARILNTEGLPGGFDAADLEREGCDDPVAWLEARLATPAPAETETPSSPAPETRTTNVLTLVTFINTNPAWRDALRFNLLTENYEVCPPFPPQNGPKGPPRPMHDPHDVLLATMYFQANGFPKASKFVVWDALVAVAHQHSYHPVRDYLGTLKWDGISRVGSLFQHYFNAVLPDDPVENDRQVAYLEHISVGFMVGAVARAMQPGCKHDHVPVVIGRNQGLLKSSAIRALCRDPTWFSDDISPDLADRDTKESLRGKWICELSEIPHVRRETERVKAFFSKQADRYRAAFGRANQDHPRQGVFIGSSNDLEFVDVTGNRRFWPFHSEGRIDLDAIERDRDQLWAEALALYRQGVIWWLPPTIEMIAAERQEAFVEADVWDDLIAAWTTDHPGPFTIDDLFAKDTGITPYREISAVTKADQMRAARSLTKLKFIKSQRTINGRRAMWWTRL